jgi:hypothetical protein
VRVATGFFGRDDPVHRALRGIARSLEEAGVPYAVAGGMAVVAHGYERTTVDVDVVVTAGGLEAVRCRFAGAMFEDRRTLRDTEHGVRVQFLVTGEFPGDGKPKPVSFPDPARCAIELGDVCYLRLTALIELKLASGISHPGRLKDLADVQELIRVRGLPLELRDELHPFVRQKYVELWQSLREF